MLKYVWGELCETTEDTKTGEHEEHLRYIQGNSVPYSPLVVSPVIRSDKTQLGWVHATLPPVAELNQTNSNAARTSKLTKPTKNAIDEGPIWLANRLGAGTSPETYTIPRDKR